LTQESPTLDLAIDCFHFVTGHFDGINLSSLHIYHSALVLAPKQSIIWGLYKVHADPLVRIVQGVPMSWDTSTAATTRSSTIVQAVWSPCNRFIAIAWGGGRTVDVLDPVTLQQLQALELQIATSHPFNLLIFSPDSHILTYFSLNGLYVLVVSWDLQTGGKISTIRHRAFDRNPTRYPPPSITHSANGKMVGVLYGWGLEGTDTHKIIIFDVVSGIHINSHLLDNQPSYNIWTQGESLLFATSFDVTTAVIWKVRFTFGTTPVEVKRLPVPIHNIGHLRYIQPIPTNPSQFLLVFYGWALIWDSQTSKTLLSGLDVSAPNTITFSSDGHFFAHSTRRSEIYLWKESPTGYILQEILVPYTAYSKPCLSPNGESIVVFGSHTVWLWKTKGFTTAPSRISTQVTKSTQPFLLNFFPNGVFAAVARRGDNTVMVIDLNSGIPWLTIDVGMEAYGLQVTRCTVLVVGSSSVIAWKLPTGDLISNIRMGVEDNLWTTNLDYLPLGEHNYVCGASISPDSCHIAIITDHGREGRLLSVYSMFTGVCLMCTMPVFGTIPWFSTDGHNILCFSYSGEIHHEYTLGAGHSLRKVYSNSRHVEELCWAPPHGYQLTSDWWILDPDGKQLLMLPPPWRSYNIQQAWKGRFLVLLHYELLEPVILDLGVKQ